MLSTRKLPFQIVAVDPLEARREKMNAIYARIDASGRGSGKFTTNSIHQAKETVKEWTKGVGCTSVLEVISTTSPCPGKKSQFTRTM
jgi:threonine dehydrogenase-like Zn-dependent dehydrogenase